MKCLVPVKRVIDYNVKVHVQSDHKTIESHNVKMSMNPFDEIAIEEALRQKEQGIIKEIIAVCIGTSAVQETLRTALARGADKAYLIETDIACVPLQLAQILKAFITQYPVDLVLMGKQSIDGDNNQTGQMLASLLDCALGTFASKIEKKEDAFLVTREIDGGLETLKLNLPAVVTTDLRLNEPRYISLPNVMKAKQKPLETIILDTLNINLKTHVNIVKRESPPIRKTGIKVDTIDDLLDKLKNKEKVI